MLSEPAFCATNAGARKMPMPITKLTTIMVRSVFPRAGLIIQARIYAAQTYKTVLCILFAKMPARCTNDKSLNPHTSYWGKEKKLNEEKGDAAE